MNITTVTVTIAKHIVGLGNELTLQDAGWDEFVIHKEAYLNIKKQLEELQEARDGS